LQQSATAPSTDNPTPAPRRLSTPQRLLNVAWLTGTRAWKGFDLHNCAQMAAAISYYALFAIVPLVMVVIGLLVTILGSEDLEERLTERITEAVERGTASVRVELDPEAIDELQARYGFEAVADINAELQALNDDPETDGERQELAVALNSGETVEVAGYALTDANVRFELDNLVADVVRDVIASGETISVVGFVVFAVGSLGLFGAVNRSLNVVWSVERKRPLLSRKLVEVIMLLGLGLLFLAAVVLAAVAEAFSSLSFPEPLEGISAILWRLIGFLGPFGITFLVLLATYRLVPNRRGSWGEVWPGALLAALAMGILRFGYVIYLANFGEYDAVYGALAGVLTFMLLVYLMSTLLLLGAEISAAYPGALADSESNEEQITVGERVREVVRRLRASRAQ
jgi:YihY family inner membrane protein